LDRSFLRPVGPGAHPEHRSGHPPGPPTCVAEWASSCVDVGDRRSAACAALGRRDADTPRPPSV